MKYTGSVVNRQGRRGTSCPHWQAECIKPGPLADILMFSIFWFSVSCCILFFAGCYRFFS